MKSIFHLNILHHTMYTVMCMPRYGVRFRPKHMDSIRFLCALITPHQKELRTELKLAPLDTRIIHIFRGLRYTQAKRDKINDELMMMITQHAIYD